MPDSTPVVVQIAPAADGFRMLTTPLAERIELYATEHQPELAADEYARLFLSQLWLGNPGLLALGIIEPEKGLLLGHVIAEHCAVGRRSWVAVRQMRADQNVGLALSEALERVEAWARQRGADLVLACPHRDWKAWEKRGFHLVTHTVAKDLRGATAE